MLTNVSMVDMNMNNEPQGIRGQLRFQEPMYRYTTWRVGGPAKCFFIPEDVQDLQNYLQQLPQDEPLLWLGLGSNLLVRDGGFNGTVIVTQHGLSEIEHLGENRVRVEAGVSCAKTARLGAKHSLCGVEFLAGIPGTIGGALAMNAGAFGGETWDWVEKVMTIDRTGQLHERTPEDYNIGYRTVIGPQQEWFVEAYLKLESGDSNKTTGRIRALLDERNEKQPIGSRSCGSVFRNPEGDYAANLIEISSLKGVCVGGACVSDKHANFIINTGEATAADIETLINQVADTVANQHGVRLQPEVRIIGDKT